MQFKNRQQQLQFQQRFAAECDKVIISWDNELRDWYNIARSALRFASPASTGTPQHQFTKLFEQEKTGLNMNVVAVLCNNCEGVNAHQMNMDAEEWAKFLTYQNASIAQRWRAFAVPIEKKLFKEYEIMEGKEVGMKLIKGEA